MHSKNEKQYTISQKTSIFDLLQCDIPSKHKRKYVQFAIIYHILACGHPMTNFESFKILFQMLKMKNVGRKHWNDSSSWGMVEVMHSVLLNVTKATFPSIAYTSISTNEVKTINNTQWLSIHLYVGQAWKRILILLCVGTIRVLATFDNIFALMVETCLDFGGLGFEELRAKLISIGCDGSSVFM
jgi:hypothetical protein